MIIAVDFDGTIVEQDHPYDDLVTKLRFVPGAREGLYALKQAGHVLILWSGRASVLIRPDRRMALVEAGIVNPDERERSHGLNLARWEQMINFVETHLPNLFTAIDDGRTGKPPVDLIIDNIAIGLGYGPMKAAWNQIAHSHGGGYLRASR